MYNIGTVTTTANSPKITGTGTRWKDNTTLVSVGQIVLIENGSTLIINCIDSIESNTALTLAFPVSAKLTNVKYRILTTMIDSISDGVNKATAQVIASEIFTDIFTELMTGTGTLDFELPNGQKVKLRTESEKDKLLDGKVDKTTGEMESITVYKKGLNYPTLRLKKDDGSTLYLESKPDEQPVMAQLYERGPDGKIKYSISFPKSMGTAMQVGDYGFGGNGSGTGLWANWTTAQVQDFFKTGSSSIWRNQQESTPYGARYGASMYVRSSDTFWNMNVNHSDAGATITSGLTGSDPSTFKVAKLYSTLNTTKDSNGNLKAASPIIRVFADHVDPNEEAEGVTLKKLHTGIYQLHGVLGLHSDASWGGINGGITIPCGINQLPLVYALYDVLEKGEQHPFDGRIVEPDEDGDIVLYTTYRKHDLPQNIQYERFKLYPEFLKEVDGEKVELTPGEPCDIPVGHWVDVRVNMPSNSIYNQKQAEAERLAKIEAERLAQEEAKRIAEEAEMAEQEAAEREQYDLGDNDVLL